MVEITTIKTITPKATAPIEIFEITDIDRSLGGLNKYRLAINISIPKIPSVVLSNFQLTKDGKIIRVNNQIIS